ncbi:MAG: DEAD/DEAH box helicase [Synergistaceae bacterium]|jgi:transcription-repair coupling factor (superfamily II helicase)|nr:DEAD/DEAH box helicase [Synergistaceae bacterium]
MMKDGVTFDGLSALDAGEWRKSRSLHLPVGGAARPWICRGFERPLLVVLQNSRFARDFLADAESMRGLVPDIPRAAMLPEIAIASYADDPHMLEAQKAERGEVMHRWAEEGGALLATPGALMGPMSVGGDRLTLETGDSLSRGRLLDWLGGRGYERVDIVWSPGQFTYRGGIVDLFDPKETWPMRVEFFDDDIESMRFFATDTQRSVRRVARFEAHALSSRKGASLGDFFPADMHVLLMEPGELENAADSYAWLRAGVERGVKETDSKDESVGWLEVSGAISLYPRLRVTASVAKSDHKTQIIGLPNFRGRRGDLESYCRGLESRDISIFLLSDIEHSRQWAESQGYRSAAGAISEGFVDARAKTAFIGDLELSGLSLSGASGERAVPLDWGDRLLPGQWVVHEDYGVARYMGSEQIGGPDGVQEYLVLEYAEERRLKIPVMHFHKISPYKTYPGMDPSADNLRGGHWKKLSERAKEQAAETARYLIDSYAKRELSEGHAFAGDEEQEAEFERAFPFKETADQLRAIEDVIRDMKRQAPMDRLLVGDVGFGKTEVALRGTARCVFEGRQAALLAPTTLLAQQHYDTWSARFDSFGARVEVLSRFVPPSKQRKILEDTAGGSVDVLIGTHRMLASEVAFKKLGLVIIDEEHRFGVMHKERLKNMYPGVDVLMLSATPIPRSLHMSLSGLRDLSLLETPPRKRLPVITAVGPWSETLVKNAVVREHARGGQIFYVHNRVGTIDGEAMMIRRMFPKLRVAVAHGRMLEKDLKDTMERFASGELDMLVCTTIVESGLDMPRANTLIVSDAQELGLAQMHQLRGRVGRRTEQAFALFLHPPEASLTKEASERLEAIAAMGEFGAGYELAKKDLEIRGGGELVGTAQHGNLGRVGFQRYCDLLEDAIRRAKGDYRERTQVDVGFPSAIPSDYLPHESLRVALYRKLLWTQDLDVLDSLADETVDRFGPMPEVLRFLFDVSRIRVMGMDFNISRVLCGRDETVAQFDPDGRLAKSPPPPGWFRRLDGFLGPGGFGALRNLISHLTKPREVNGV